MRPSANRANAPWQPPALLEAACPARRRDQGADRFAPDEGFLAFSSPSCLDLSKHLKRLISLYSNRLVKAAWINVSPRRQRAPAAFRLSGAGGVGAGESRVPGTDAGRGAAGAGAVSLRPHTPERAAGGTDPCVRPPRDLWIPFPPRKLPRLPLQRFLLWGPEVLSSLPKFSASLTQH